MYASSPYGGEHILNLYNSYKHGAGFAAGGRTDGTVAARCTDVVGRVLGLGAVVGLTFALLWAPFCVYPHDEDGGGCLSSLGQASSTLA